MPAWAAAGCFAAASGLAFLSLGGGRKTTGRAKALLGRYTAGAVPEAQRGALLAGLVAQAGRILRAARRDRLIAARLEAAGISASPAEWSLAWAGAGLAAAVAAAAAANVPAGMVTGIVAGAAGSRLAVSARISRRRRQFASQMPDLLQVAAGSLRTGMSLPQALERAAAEAPQPAAAELGRAVAETRIGADLADALDGVAGRMASRDLQWAVRAVRIHRQVGGNLAEILDSTAATMRERESVAGHARALSAEGRLSGRILIALPVLIGGWLFLTDRTYMRPLYTTPAGIVMTAAAVVLIVIGALWMRAAAKVEA